MELLPLKLVTAYAYHFRLTGIKGLKADELQFFKGATNNNTQ